MTDVVATKTLVEAAVSAALARVLPAGLAGGRTLATGLGLLGIEAPARM